MRFNLGERFLTECLSHLMYQTFTDFEVIVSDQSDDDSLKKICDTFSHVLDVKHVKNTSDVKNAANNVNCAIKHASGKIVKLLFVDDFFVDLNALQKIKNAFAANPDKKWLISGFLNSNQEKSSYSNPRMPSFDQIFANGDNSTGNPSNYSVRRECAVEMDENLRWIVDKEYFHRTYHHYGSPIMISEILVCFRDHDDSKFRDPEYQALDRAERTYWVDKFSREVEHKLIPN